MRKALLASSSPVGMRRAASIATGTGLVENYPRPVSIRCFDLPVLLLLRALCYSPRSARRTRSDSQAGGGLCSARFAAILRAVRVHSILPQRTLRDTEVSFKSCRGRTWLPTVRRLRRFAQMKKRTAGRLVRADLRNEVPTGTQDKADARRPDAGASGQRCLACAGLREEGGESSARSGPLVDQRGMRAPRGGRLLFEFDA